MFAKILLTIIAVAVVWFGFKYLQRVAELRARSQRAPQGDQPRFEPVADGESVQDLVKCPICSTFRSPKLGPCGRAECPY